MDMDRGGANRPDPTKESVLPDLPSDLDITTAAPERLYRAWRVELDPTLRQRAMLGKASGAARWAYNYGLRRCQEERAAGRRRPTRFDLQKEIVVLKHLPCELGGQPWLKESAKCAPESGVHDLENAWENFFSQREGRRSAYPTARRRKDGGHVTFSASNSMRADYNSFTLPRIGRIRVQPGERGYVPVSDYATVHVTEVGGRWFASVERAAVIPASPNLGPTIAIDLGVRKLGTLPDGTIIVNPQAEKQEARRLKRAVLSVSRKRRAAAKRLGPHKKGEKREDSKRLRRAHRRLARVKTRIANIRRDALHKVTTALAKSSGTIVLEDLPIANMTRKRVGKGRAAKAGLNRVILDAGWGEFRHHLAYKCAWYGSRLVLVPPQYTSQDCSSCGARTNVGACETYTCSSCGLVLDRDVNAARNLLIKYAAECVNSDVAVGYTETENARGVAVRPKRIRPQRQAAVSRECRAEG